MDQKIMIYFFFKHMLPLDVKIVVEPFGGSFAIIKHFYKDTNKYTFHNNPVEVNNKMLDGILENENSISHSNGNSNDDNNDYDNESFYSMSSSSSENKRK